MSNFFVLGSPRSGTSLFRIMLACHRDIVVPPECGFILWLRDKYGQWAARDGNDADRIDRFVADLMACKKFDTWGLAPSSIRNVVNREAPRDYPSLCATVFLAYSESIGKKFRIWGDKNNFHVQHGTELLQLFPRARFIHIVRDGRDVACSYQQVMKDVDAANPYWPRLPTDMQSIASQWASNLTAVDNLFNEFGEKGLRITYERLVLDTERTLKEVCNFLAVEWDADMLRYAELNEAHRLEPEETLPWKRKTLRAVDVAGVGQHMTMLSETERREFERVAWRVLARHGYALGFEWSRND